MSSNQQQRHTVVVATENSSSRAELLRMTLAARGISASIGPRAAGYPSLDFVAGIGVLVSPEDEELARNILSGIGLEADSPEAGGRLLAPEASHFFAARVVLMQHH